MKEFIRVRHVQTVCNVKPKPWSQILGPFRFKVRAPGLKVLDPGLESWIEDPRSWIVVLRSPVTSLELRWIRYYKAWRKIIASSVAVITNCERKFLKSVAGITNCGSYYKVWHKIITVSQILKSVAIITKWDVTLEHSTGTNINQNSYKTTFCIASKNVFTVLYRHNFELVVKKDIIVSTNINQRCECFCRNNFGKMIYCLSLIFFYFLK